MDILWIDDCTDDYPGISRLLESKGTSLRFAANVQQAFVILKDRSFDLIVLDLNIPLGFGSEVDALADTHHNGVHVVHAFDDLLRSRGTRIVCVTNYESMAREVLARYNIDVAAKSDFMKDIAKHVFGL